jgi:hypothetical protein
VREEYGGKHLSDDDLFRRHFAPPEDIEAALAAGPVRKDYPFHSSLSELISEAMERSGARHLELQTNGVSLELRR